MRYAEVQEAGRLPLGAWTQAASRPPRATTGGLEITDPAVLADFFDRRWVNFTNPGQSVERYWVGFRAGTVLLVVHYN